LVIKYYIPKLNKKELIPVCRDLFLSTHLLSKNRVQGRDGDGKSNLFMDRKNEVIALLKKSMLLKVIIVEVKHPVEFILVVI